MPKCTFTASSKGFISLFLVFVLFALLAPAFAMNTTQWIIDFDSTLIQVETLDELAALALASHPERESRLAEIRRLTDLGMEGKLSYHEALSTRLKLLDATKNHVAELVPVLQKTISPSFLRNRHFLKENRDQIYLVSGGFEELIWPVVESLGLRKDHVFANRFLYNHAGQIVGVDESSKLSQDGGKVAQLRDLNLSGEVVVIGDGFTDYEIRQAGLAQSFVAFTENVHRESVVNLADFVAADLDQVLISRGISGESREPGERVLLLEGIHIDAVRGLERAGCIVEQVSGALSEDDLCERIQGVSVLGLRSKTQVTSRVLEHANRLEAIGAFCIGTNQIDLKACCEKGIAVFNAPYSNTRSVVELAIGEIILLMRRTIEKHERLRQGCWEKSCEGCVEVRGKALGIVGYGKIGSQLSVLAEALGMYVYYYDSEERLPLGNARRCQSLGELLESADVVSVHVDGRPENEKLLGAPEFERMRDGVVFLNLSRGSVVDVDALSQALRSGKVAGAAVDVYPKEPKGKGEAFETPLRELDNVILTPHVGGSTEEAQRHIGAFVAQRIGDYLQLGSTQTSVNFPVLKVGRRRSPHRLVHIHENVPGMLAQIARVLADEDINIEGQYLKTNEHLGYVIVDTDSSLDEKMLSKLKSIPHTKRVRQVY